MSKVTNLDVVDSNPDLGLSFYGKVIGEGNIAITTCDGINRDLISIEQSGDNEDPDLILLFGREVVENLRDALTLHLQRIDEWEKNKNENPKISN